MKRQRFKRTKLCAMCLAIGAIAYFGCTKDDTLNGGGPETDRPLFSLLGSDPLLEMEYEMETFTKTRATGETVDNLDRIIQAPRVERRKVKTTVKENGEVRMEIEKMTAEMDLTMPNKNLPNNFPVPHKTVMEGGKVTLYDAKGNELHSLPMKTPKMEAAAISLKAAAGMHTADVINQAVAGMQSSLFLDSLKMLIHNAEQLGFTVKDISDSVTSIRMPNSLAGLTEVKGESVHLIDKERNLLLATRSYDKDGEMLMCMMIRYDGGEKPFIKGFRQEVRNTLPSGAEAIMEITTSIENLQFTLNK